MADEKKADEKKPQASSFRPIMIGLAIGSGIFLLQRYLFNIDVDIALPIATFFTISSAMFLLQRPSA